MLFAGTLEPLTELKEESDDEAMFSTGFGFGGEFLDREKEEGFKPTSVEDKVAQVKKVLAAKEAAQRRSEGKAKLDNSEEGSSKRKSTFEDGGTAKKSKLLPPGVESGVMFSSLRLSRVLTRAIHSLGWKKTTPIQTKAIPLGLAGHDIVGCAKTGSGKTAAFMLPILERLLNRPNSTRITRVLILSPTRELATQIYKMGRDLASLTDITFCFAVGGLSITNQRLTLSSKPDIVVATPGRMIDHLRNSIGIHFEDLEILVLDEADRLLDMGFIAELKEICRSLPSARQTMLYSATISEEVAELSEIALRNPKSVNVDLGGNVVDSLNQEFVRVRGKLKGKEEAIVMHLCRSRFRVRTMVFGDTRREVRRLKILMELLNMKCLELTGSLTQMQRMTNLQKFKDGETNFLVCTDVASRGLDISNVYAVVNLRFPDIKTYIHRVGRTARAGRKGIAVTLVADDERRQFKRVANATKAKGKISHHQLNKEKVSKMHAQIVGLADAIQAVLDQEHVEKTIREVEQRQKKYENEFKHKDEIMSRPAKTWFCTWAEKQEARENFHQKKNDVKLTKEEIAKRQRLQEREEEMELSRQAKREAKILKKKENMRHRMHKLVLVDDAWKKLGWEKTEESYLTEHKIDRIGRLGERLSNKYPEKKPFKPKKPKALKRHTRRHRKRKR